MALDSPYVQATLVAAAVAAAGIIVLVVERAVHRRVVRSDDTTWASLERHCRRSFRVTLTVTAVLVAWPYSGLDEPLQSVVRHALVLALIAALVWLIIQLSRVLEDAAQARFDVDVLDNRRARRARTQIVMFRRIANAILIVVAVAMAVLTFPSARTIGASLLISAGVLGVIAGLAAQSTLGNLLAGLQIALSDPLRIDDVVVVDGEWGRVDEITLTYVVVRTWDNRMLILPISWFTTYVFQNWTRHEASVLGSIVVHVDFSTPIEELRTEMQRLVHESPLWDGRDWVQQVIDVTPTTMVVRGLASTADAPSNWDLCCDIREKLLLFLQRQYPGALPKVRADLAPQNPVDRPLPHTPNQRLDAIRTDRAADETDSGSWHPTQRRDSHAY